MSTHQSASRPAHRSLRRPDLRPEVRDAHRVRPHQRPRRVPLPRGRGRHLLRRQPGPRRRGGRPAAHPGPPGSPRRRQHRQAPRPDRHQPRPLRADPRRGGQRRGRRAHLAGRARAHRGQRPELQPGRHRRQRRRRRRRRERRGQADGQLLRRQDGDLRQRRAGRRPAREAQRHRRRLHRQPAAHPARRRRRAQRAATQHPRHRQDDRRRDPAPRRVVRPRRRLPPGRRRPAPRRHEQGLLRQELRPRRHRRRRERSAEGEARGPLLLRQPRRPAVREPRERRLRDLGPRGLRLHPRRLARRGPQPRPAGAVQRPAGRGLLRRHRVGRHPALVQRQRRPVGHVLPRDHAAHRRQPPAPAPQGHDRPRHRRRPLQRGLLRRRTVRRGLLDVVAQGDGRPQLRRRAPGDRLAGAGPQDAVQRPRGLRPQRLGLHAAPAREGDRARVDRRPADGCRHPPGRQQRDLHQLVRRDRQEVRLRRRLVPAQLQAVHRRGAHAVLRPLAQGRRQRRHGRRPDPGAGAHRQRRPLRLGGVRVAHRPHRLPALVPRRHARRLGRRRSPHRLPAGQRLAARPPRPARRTTPTSTSATPPWRRSVPSVAHRAGPPERRSSASR